MFQGQLCVIRNSELRLYFQFLPIEQTKTFQSTELERVNNKIGAICAQRIVDLLARNKELENKNKKLSEDLNKANTELDEEKEFANELKLQNDKFEKRELVHKEENRKLSAELNSQKVENRKIREKAKKSADLLLQIQNM